MYSLKAVFTKNPIQISGVVMGGVNLAIIVDWLTLSADGVAALNIFLTGLLGLFVVTNTVNSAKLDELHDAESGAGEVQLIIGVLFALILLVLLFKLLGVNP